jgi:stage VI sporulation protein D
MKQIIPFNKDIAFKTMIKEIQSISLEHTLEIKQDNSIKGDFIVSGSYKMTEASTIAEEFSYKIPVDIYIDDEYDLSESTIDIDDFKYSIINDDTLNVNIDLCLDNIKLITEEKDDITEISLDEDVIKTHIDKDYLKLKSEVEESYQKNENTVEDQLELSRDDNTDIEVITGEEEQEDSIMIPINNSTDDKDKEKVESLFNKFSDEEDSYSTYKVYIVRENDTLESIMEKYKVSIDILREYNNIDDLKLNDKLIIPSCNEEA